MFTMLMYAYLLSLDLSLEVAVDLVITNVFTVSRGFSTQTLTQNIISLGSSTCAGFCFASAASVLTIIRLKHTFYTVLMRADKWTQPLSLLLNH